MAEYRDLIEEGADSTKIKHVNRYSVLQEHCWSSGELFHGMYVGTVAVHMLFLCVILS